MPRKDPEAFKAYQKEYNKTYIRPKYSIDKKIEKSKIRKEKLRDQINQYKLNLGCKDCGYKEQAYVLDFDHLNDKMMGISNMLQHGFSWENIKKEISKCEVVCSNCHRVRTYNRNKNI